MSERCDILIAGGVVIDGSGEPRRRGDVAVTGERIVALGDLGHMEAGVEIDAAGLIVAPGFIDAHTHDDRAVLSGPDMTNKISQGVTTVVAGNCGVSLAPLTLAGDPPPPMNLLGNRADYGFPTMADYVAALDADPPALNVAMLTGHSTPAPSASAPASRTRRRSPRPPPRSPPWSGAWRRWAGSIRPICGTRAIT